MGKVNKTDREWQRELSPEEYRITRQRALNQHLRGNTGILSNMALMFVVVAARNCFRQMQNMIVVVVGKFLSPSEWKRY